MTDTQQVEELSTSDAVSADTSVSASLGAILQAAREEKKLSQQDVSDSLRYSVKQVDALEHDAFSLLPDAMITRGFIRNYARLLEIDASPLLEIYRQTSPTKSPSHLAVNASMQPVQLTKDSQPWLVYILGSILVLFFVLAWFVYLEYLPKDFKLQKNEEPVAAATQSPPVVAQDAVEMALPEAALPAAERQAEESPVVAVEGESAPSVVNHTVQPTAPAQMAPHAVATPLATPPATVPTAPVKSEAPIKAESQVKVESPVPAAQPQTQPQAQVLAKPEAKVEPAATAAATKKLSMTATEKSWVRVSDKAGQILYEATLNAGDTQSLSFKTPFSVVIGNAKATTVNVSEQAMDLASYTRSNVARINLE